MVPADALRGDESAGTSVWVVRNGRVEARKVRLGLRTLDAAEVLEGLSDGELVLIGAAPLPGQRVRAGSGAALPGRAGSGTREDAGAAMSNAMGR